MSASLRAQVCLRSSLSRTVQSTRCAPPPKLPFTMAFGGGRRYYALGGKPASGIGATSSSPDVEEIKAPGSWYSIHKDESPGTPEEATASDVSESESKRAETSPSITSVDSDLPSISSDTSAEEPPSSKDPWRPEFGFAFDIDGVLLHRSDPIPGAAESLKYLQKHNIPFILLTNGGGKSEADRVAELSAKLGVNLDTSNFIQSHTPYQLLATESRAEVPLSSLPQYLKRTVGIKSLRDSTILVLGSNASQARRIAQGYGFQSVVTPGDILNANPELFPFDPLSEFYSKQEILPLPKPVYNSNNPDVKLSECLKIDAILVFNDPRDWAFDIQLITDLLLSYRGYLGTYSKNNGKHHSSRRWQNEGQPALVFSNSDLLWSTGYHLPRFGQGAFRKAVRAIFTQVTGQTEGAHAKRHSFMEFSFGKPERAMYHFAASKLSDHFNNMWKLDSETTTAEALQGSDDQARESLEPSDSAESIVGKGNLPELKKVYMVGDNPESDIRGAVQWRKYLKTEATGPKSSKGGMPLWEACLVRTGVWNEDKVSLENLEQRGAKPDTVQDDVKSVLRWVLEREGWPEKME